MKKQVLYISYDGMTDPLGQSQVLPYLAGLSKSGYEFTILSFEKKARLESEKNTIQQIVDKAGIRWVPLTFTSRPPFISKLYDKLRMRRTAVQLHKQFNFYMTHCRSYISAEAGFYLKQHYKVPFLFDMRGFWPDERVDNKQWPQHNILFRYLYQSYKRKEIIFLKEAAAVVALTQAAKTEMQSWPAFGKLDVDIIPCCADLQHFDFHNVTSSQTSELKRTLNISPSSRVITYLGSFGGPYMTAEMLAFFKQLLASDPNYIMVFYSKDDPDMLVSEVEQHGIPADKIRVQYVKRNELPVYLSISDFSLFFIRNTYSKIASSPTKHAELMGMGIPAICNAIGDTGHIVSTTQTGILIDQFDEAGYAKAIEQMAAFNMPKELIRKTAFDYFNLESGIQKYFTVYKKIKPVL